MTGVFCVSCGHGPLVAENHGCTGAPYAELHVGRGLCGTCYGVERRAGRLADWERKTWPTAALVDEAELLRARGLLWREVAAELGVKKGSLEAARRRWRKTLQQAHRAAS